MELRKILRTKIFQTIVVVLFLQNLKAQEFQIFGKIEDEHKQLVISASVILKDSLEDTYLYFFR